MNEYFELIEDSDMESSRSWIWYCSDCGALFGSKAIPNRTIFPWFGYHPSDGNCQVLSDELRINVRHKAEICECSVRIKRVLTVKLLKNLLSTT